MENWNAAQIVLIIYLATFSIVPFLLRAVIAPDVRAMIRGRLDAKPQTFGSMMTIRLIEYAALVAILYWGGFF